MGFCSGVCGVFIYYSSLIYSNFIYLGYHYTLGRVLQAALMVNIFPRGFNLIAYAVLCSGICNYVRKSPVF